MRFKRLPLGVYYANCYLITDETSKATAVIDPGGDAEELIGHITAEGLNVKYIILTHGHGDHIGAVAELKEFTGAPVCIHKLDERMLLDSKLNLTSVMGNKRVELKADKYLEDKEIIRLGDATELEIIHTPGHTPGGICVKSEDCIFSGDTLFACSIGRTDLEGGSFDEIIASIKNKLLIYSEDTKVYPGHGNSTSVNIEKTRNPYL